jgi:formylglycine-generating enzyme required for sulfatase activity
MKPRFAKSFPFLLVLGLAVWPVAPRASAQTSAGLDIQTYAGLTITGAVGTVYSIEYVTDLVQTNDWRSMTFFKLPGNPYLWVDKTAPVTGRRFYRAVQLDVPTNMVCIQPGTFQPGVFTLGSPTNELGRESTEEPQTTVTISRGFLMGKYEVTQKEYQAVMGSNPSYFTGNPNLPVDSVSWNDATSYCVRLTQQKRAAGRILTNCVYRLPTEAEWEYVCRAGTTTRFSYGDDLTYASLASYAWYSDNSGGTTHPVGQKLPNPWSLYDMHGNVWEWCQDWWSDTYPGGSVVDPHGPAMGSYHVIRSGRWGRSAEVCRSASRGRGDPTGVIGTIGFRVVLAPGEP